MDLKNLTTFIHVAELNSFSKAALALGYSQSTVSFQIRQLETELNAQLFERIHHTVALTEKGREVLNYAHRIRRMTMELTETMEGQQDLKGHIRLAMADSLCDSLFDSSFPDFCRQHPGLTLKIIAAGTGEMFRLMNHNEADAILTLDSHIYDREYVIFREETVKMHFIASAFSPLAKRPSLSVAELLSWPFLLTEKGMSYRRLLDEGLAERSLEVTPVLEMGSARLICSLIGEGAGISFLPDYVTEQDVQAGAIVRLNVRDFEVEIWKQLLYHRDKWVSPQLEAVLEYCAKREFLLKTSLS
ncbi:MAG: LysR family transcriptional regulator [Lachnospiraceae bacterium]|uniref:LysR family transcriptional regulator n=1 Tax=Candidatus Merdisoma sp. JLR.KK011 TaxID=3114299 RepID=UPI001434D7F9|nr:LysR family transcriptional regulator [Lachnospiraceae bacterium]MCI9622930.1 LysR family transcriptional regulator [Lachnospiraceae bacterium]GFI08981.1 HTH-type transcriptional activator CmpR [Lachnospiraceae bacterium]